MSKDERLVGSLAGQAFLSSFATVACSLRTDWVAALCNHRRVSFTPHRGKVHHRKAQQKQLAGATRMAFAFVEESIPLRSASRTVTNHCAQG